MAVAPHINNLVPASGSAGTVVTVYGYWNPVQGTGHVSFNGVNGQVQSWNGTTIVITVPSGATTGNVTVVDSLGSTSNGFLFIVTPLLVIGSLYIPNYNGIAWTQPNGPGTTVYPQQNTGSFGFPQNQLLMQEPGQGLWNSGCGHWYDCLQAFRDYDSLTGMSVAVLTCPLCTYIMRTVEPYESIEDSTQFPILIP